MSVAVITGLKFEGAKFYVETPTTPFKAFVSGGCYRLWFPLSPFSVELHEPTVPSEAENGLLTI